MFNLKRLILPLGLLVLISSATFGLFSFYRKEKPFYERLKKRKKLLYKVQNWKVEESLLIAELTQGNLVFNLNVSFSDENIIHLLINNESNSRYKIQDVVTLESKVEPLTTTFTHPYLYIIYKLIQIEINCETFELKIYKNNELILNLNSQTFIIEDKEPNVGIAADFIFPDSMKAYGLSQHAERLSLSQTLTNPYRLYNTDRFAYSAENPYQSLYGTVPLIYAHGKKQTTGVLWLNASETFIDVDFSKGLKATFFSESGTVEFYVLAGSTLKDCVEQNAQLTGVVPLPSLWVLGYHQSRYSYISQDEVIEVSNKFDENNLPLDSLWMDIDYTDDKKYFTWNPETYPKPEQLLNFLESKNRQAVVIIDPHIKVDNKYSVYTKCSTDNFFVKNPHGGDFKAKCWPGDSSWIDFLNPKARLFYSSLHKTFAKAPNLHIWNDMNEPALFETQENSMPKNVVHFEGWLHRDVHNLYGFYQTMATYEGLLNRPNLRPFVLTRSHFIGSQRFAAIWTGDNTANWNHLKISIPMCLTASLGGFSLCGADIGGFVKHPDDELLQRWYQLGMWLPFFRNHSNRNVPKREPFLYNETIQKRIRDCLEQRYKYLWYWYTLFWQHCTTLLPVVRPLVYQYPQDENVWDLDEEFLVGENILVCPVIYPGVDKIDIYLPGGDNEIWYYNGDYYQSGYISVAVTLDTTPVFYKSGSIIPIVTKKVSSSHFLKDHPISFDIYCDKDNNASGVLYCDDTKSFNYLDNDYTYLRFDLTDSKITNVKINRRSKYNKSVILNSISLYGYKKNVEAVGIKIEDEFTFDPSITIASFSNCIQIEGLNINVQKPFSITLLSNEGIK